MLLGGDAGLGWAGIWRGGCQAWQGCDTGRVGRCVHCKVNMVPSEATCPLVASPFCPHEPGARSGRAEGGGPRRIRGSEAGEGAAAGPRAGGEGVRAACGRTMQMSIATPSAPGSGGPRSARAADAGAAVIGRSRGRALADPRAHGIFFFLSF